ncbi:MAG: TRAP transporter fused permease subunit, partial [Oscillospiraceae bacterium]|nr:TRAP transporter fused permease subunit [Oscillospiraceae bacterium]
MFKDSLKDLSIVKYVAALVMALIAMSYFFTSGIGVFDSALDIVLFLVFAAIFFTLLYLKKDIISVLAFIMGLFFFYTSGFGIFSTGSNLAIYLFFTNVLILLMRPMIKGKKNTWWMNLIDAVLIVAISVAVLYWLFEMPNYARTRVGMPNQTDIVLGLTLVFLSLEVCRRVLGLVLSFIGLAMLGMLFFAHHLPGIFAARQIPLRMMVPFLYFTDGIFGTITGVFAVFIMPFMVFGSFMKHTGGGEFFVRFCTGAAGRITGGPAVIAVIGSGIMGSITGTPVANVVSTGQFTIPLMKEVGYSPEFAGAVEASSSVGGTMLPPVMGAGAFILATATLTPISTVMLMSLVPGVLYFLAVGMQVFFNAKKNNLKTMNEEDIPDWRTELKRGWYFFGAIIVLTIGMFAGFSIPRVAFAGSIFLFLCSFIRKDTRLNIKKLYFIFEDAGKDSLHIGAAAATMGIVMSGLTLHGLGLSLSHSLLQIAGGNLFVLMIFVCILGMILGMGLTKTAAYILLAIMAAPPMIEFGLEPVVAHLICYWLSMISHLCPPFAVSAITAAGIAKSSPTKTGALSSLLGIYLYLIPF